MRLSWKNQKLNVVEVWNMKKRYSVMIFLTIVTVAVLYWYFALGGVALLQELPGEYTMTFVTLFIIVASVTILYKVGAFFLKSFWLKLGAKEGEAIMLQGGLYKDP